MKDIEKSITQVKQKKTRLFRQILPILLFFILLSGIDVTADMVPGFTGVPVEGTAPLTVSFVDQSTNGNNITHYAWNFGDGSSNATEKNPFHTYIGAGTYPVSLTITDEKGISGTTTKDAFIHVQPSEYPVVRFTATPDNGTTSQPITFLDQSDLDPAVPDEMYSYLWDFGDGIIDSSNTRNVQHIYAHSGTYRANLRIQDQNGAISQAAFPETVTISNGTSAFSAQFTAVPPRGPAPLQVSFIDQSTSSSPVTGYAWNFGDGSTNSTEKNPTHTYLGAGRYDISLTITDTDGKQTTTTRFAFIYAQPSEYPVVKFTAVPRNATVGQEIYFIDQSDLDPAVPDEMYTYLWTFGDNETSGRVLTPNTQHTYASPGEYLVQLQVQDQNGAVYNTADPVSLHVVSGSSPVITATTSPGGRITPSGRLSVATGSDQSFNITSDPGFTLEDVLVDSVSVGDVSSYTFRDVTCDHTIHASFSPIPSGKHMIMADADLGGRISPQGRIMVPEGKSQSFSIIPDYQFVIGDILVDSKSVGNVSNYTFRDVTCDHTIHASFSPKSVMKHTITATTGPGGLINPSGSVSVLDGRNQTFIAIPDPGYMIETMVVDGKSIGPKSSYTFQNVKTDRTISVSFTRYHGSSLVHFR